MKKLLLTAALLFGTGCIDFDRAFEKCHESGACITADSDAGTDAGMQEDAGFLAALVPLSSAGPVCVNGFCWQNPLPQANHLNAIVGDGQRALIAGELGTLLLWDGAELRHLQLTHQNLWAIGRSGNRITVGGDNVLLEFQGGELLPNSSDDPCYGDFCRIRAVWTSPELNVAGANAGGHPTFVESDGLNFRTFDSFWPLGSSGVIGVGGPSADKLIAVTEDGLLLRRHGPSDWEDAGTVPFAPGIEARGMCVNGEDDFTIYDSADVARRHQPDGQWITLPLQPTGVRGMSCMEGGGYVIAGEGKSQFNIFRCTDQGCTDGGESEGFLNAGTVAGGVAWGVGNDGIIIKEAGKVTQLISPPRLRRLRAIGEDDAGVLWAVGDDTQLMKGVNGTWTKDLRSGAGGADWTGIVLTGVERGYITSTNGALKILRPSPTLANGSLVLTDGGSTNMSLNGIVSSGNDLIIVGERGLIAHLQSDGGFVALRDPGPTGTPDLLQVFSAGDGVAMAVGNGGVVELIADGGVSALPEVPGVHWTAGHASSANDFWVLGEQGARSHYLDGVPTDTEPQNNNAPRWVNIGGSGPNDLFAVNGFDEMFHFDGGTWDPTARPISSQGEQRIVQLPSGLYVIGDHAMVMKRETP